MKAHLVQLDIAWEDKPANYRRVERLLDAAHVEPGDLVLLPEMFDTGFSLATETTSDRGGQTLRFLLSLATDLRVTVQGGRTVHDCHAAHASNRASVVSPQGDLLADYAKVHPFTFGREGERFAGGRDVTTYTWAGPARTLRVCPAVCYDLRFPELFRIGLLQGAEAFAVIANWPEARHAHWRALLTARAIENQALVLGVNRVGKDPHLSYLGGSIALGPKGDVLGELGPEEGVLSVPVDPASVARWREVFPAWRDIKLLALDQARRD